MHGPRGTCDVRPPRHHICAFKSVYPFPDLYLLDIHIPFAHLSYAALDPNMGCACLVRRYRSAFLARTEHNIFSLRLHPDDSSTLAGSYASSSACDLTLGGACSIGRDVLQAAEPELTQPSSTDELAGTLFLISLMANNNAILGRKALAKRVLHNPAVPPY